MPFSDRRIPNISTKYNEAIREMPVLRFAYHQLAMDGRVTVGRRVVGDLAILLGRPKGRQRSNLSDKLHYLVSVWDVCFCGVLHFQIFHFLLIHGLDRLIDGINLLINGIIC